jgi:phenylpyruvate tautomerase PptA (4-oxalocrotonate tautomerase family)
VADIETKRTLVAEITDTLEKAYKLLRNLFVVIIKENPPENVASVGELIVDRKST